MRSLTSTVRTATAMVTVIIGRTILLALALALGLVLWGLAAGTVAGDTSTAPVQTPPAGAPSADPSGMAPHERPASSGDGFTDHHLFNEAAALDPSRIDDLRGDPYGACVARDGVLTPSGTCVDGFQVRWDEMDLDTWVALERQGYQPELSDPNTMWIPAEYVILAGSDDDLYVAAVDITRSVTPRPL